MNLHLLFGGLWHPDKTLPWLGTQLHLVHFCVSSVGSLGYFMRGVALPPTKAAFLHQFMTKCPATLLQTHLK